MANLKQHEVILEGKTTHGRGVRLRPMTEHDWDILLTWNSDPEVLYYSEGDNVAGYNLEQVQGIYRSVSQNAFCFIIEVDDKAIGECWLQEMNLERILKRYPDSDCRRIDLMIGEREYWGEGIGATVVGLLTEFGFFRETADMIFGCDIGDYNVGSLRAFQKAGYEIASRIKEKPGKKAKYIHDVVLSREKFFENSQKNNPCQSRT